MNKKLRTDWKRWLFVLVVCIMLLASAFFVSSATETKKSYDPNTRTVVLEKGTDKVADIKLNTPIQYGVIPGKERLVAEMTITNHQSAISPLQLVEFFDVKRNMRQTTKQFVYKEKIFDRFEWIPFGTSENILQYPNGTQYTELVQEVKQVAYYKWIPLSKSASLGVGPITIGIFTDVERGERIEWIPTYYGVKIPEFAEWFDSLDTGLVEYWSFNNTVNGNLSRYNWTSNSSDYVTGKSGTALNFTRSFSQFARIPGNISQLTVGSTGAIATINLWVNVLVRSNEGTSPPTTAGIVKLGSDANDGNGNNCMVLDSVDVQPNKWIVSCPNNLLTAGEGLPLADHTAENSTNA